jgi:hypothetical protein
MSSFNENGHTASGSTVSNTEQAPSVLNDRATLETLMPKNLSNNKRAVIERLIALHQQNSAER